MNYQKELEKVIREIEKDGIRKSLLIHSCCAPCSSYVLEYLSKYFLITIFYYNPNVYPEEEYDLRIAEQKEIIKGLKERESLNQVDGLDADITLIEGKYKPKDFYDNIRGHEQDLEGGERCLICYEMRLRETAKMAKDEDYDYFTTTLSISPHKNAKALNEIGNKVGDEYGTKHLPSDFKKNNGYKRSVELSKEFGLYRQDYCGCIYSKRESDERNKEKYSR